MLNLLEHVINTARQKGADAVKASYIRGTTTNVDIRNGQIDNLERSEDIAVGIKVYIGQQTASVTSADLSQSEIDLLLDKAISMARLVPNDPWAGLCEQAYQGFLDAHDLDLEDKTDISVETLSSLAQTAEASAMAVQGVTISDGASASCGRYDVLSMTSSGFSGQYSRTSFGLSTSVLAGAADAMERDYDYHQSIFFNDLEKPDKIGRTAGEKAVARLAPVRPKTAKLPVVFCPDTASSLLDHLGTAIDGVMIARGTSFLKDSLNKSVFSPHITVIDDPIRRRGLASQPFDSEGVISLPLVLVENGILESWLLDDRSARQLGLTSNGRAGSSSPSTTNLHFLPGSLSASDMLSEIENGVLITELMGSSINFLTGDYSRGAAGFLIKQGQVAEPVSEFTIAGNLQDMFRRLEVASDITFRYATNSPTLRIDGMTIAGS